MPNLSVKLDEITRKRLQTVAADQGTTPHALMLKSILTELDRADEHGAFVSRALQAREQVVAGGAVIDGPAFAEYLKNRARGVDAKRPEARDIAEALAPKA
jgi:predicted transcriptional regulator